MIWIRFGSIWITLCRSRLPGSYSGHALLIFLVYFRGSRNNFVHLEVLENQVHLVLNGPEFIIDAMSRFVLGAYITGLHQFHCLIPPVGRRYLASRGERSGMWTAAGRTNPHFFLYLYKNFDNHI